MEWKIVKEVLNEFQEVYFVYCLSCGSLLGGSCDNQNCENIARICYQAHVDKGKCNFIKFCNMVELQTDEHNEYVIKF